MKKNFKYLVTGHLIALLIFGILLFFTSGDTRTAVGCMIGLLIVSLVTQFSMYKAKPAAFDDKVKKLS